MENDKNPEERRPSRVHFDVASGEVATEYIPIDQDVWQEYTQNVSATPGDEDNGSSQQGKGQEKAANDNEDSTEMDAFLRNRQNDELKESIIGMEEDFDPQVNGIQRPNDIPLSSSHIFSASSPIMPVIGGLTVRLDERQELLFRAVEENDLEKVRDLMCGEDPAPDVNGINQQRRSPLIVAIRAKHLGKLILFVVYFVQCFSFIKTRTVS